MTEFVGVPPFFRVTLANIVLVCLLARKKNLHHFQIWHPCLKCLLWTILIHCTTGIFLPDGLKKKSEIGLFFDLALCQNCNLVRERPFDFYQCVCVGGGGGGGGAGRCFRAWIYFSLATWSCHFICI